MQLVNSLPTSFCQFKIYITERKIDRWRFPNCITVFISNCSNWFLSILKNVIFIPINNFIIIVWFLLLKCINNTDLNISKLVQNLFMFAYRPVKNLQGPILMIDSGDKWFQCLQIAPFYTLNHLTVYPFHIWARTISNFIN